MFGPALAMDSEPFDAFAGPRCTAERMELGSRSRNPVESDPFRPARSFDIPRLLQAADIPGLVVNPIDGDWGPSPRTKSVRCPAADSQLICKESAAAEIKSCHKKRSVRILIATCSLCLVAAVITQAEEWPYWAGDSGGQNHRL